MGKRLKHINIQSDNKTRTTNPIYLLLGGILVATILCLQILMKQEDKPKPPTPLPDLAEVNEEIITSDDSFWIREASNPEQPIQFFTPRIVELESFHIGEIYWSETKPRVRINGHLKRIGDIIESNNLKYEVVKIERKCVYLKSEENDIVRFEANASQGIRQGSMEDRRQLLENSLDLPERPN